MIRVLMARRTPGEAAIVHVRDGHPCEHSWRVQHVGRGACPPGTMSFAPALGCDHVFVWSDDLLPSECHAEAIRLYRLPPAPILG